MNANQQTRLFKHTQHTQHISALYPADFHQEISCSLSCSSRQGRGLLGTHSDRSAGRAAAEPRAAPVLTVRAALRDTHGDTRRERASREIRVVPTPVPSHPLPQHHPAQHCSAAPTQTKPKMQLFQPYKKPRDRSVSYLWLMDTCFFPRQGTSTASTGTHWMGRRKTAKNAGPHLTTQRTPLQSPHPNSF